MWCAKVRQLAEDRIAAGEPVKLCRETVALRAAEREKNGKNNDKDGTGK